MNWGQMRIGMQGTTATTPTNSGRRVVETLKRQTAEEQELVNS